MHPVTAALLIPMCFVLAGLELRLAVRMNGEPLRIAQTIGETVH